MFINVNYTYSDNLVVIKNKLESLPNTIGCDFETASKLNNEEKLQLSKSDYSILTDNTNQLINSDGLSNPYLSTITHFQVAWSDRDSFVCICTNDDIRTYIYNYLVTTNRLQLWHNACFDYRFIYHNTGKLPINYEDTRLIARCINNNADGIKCSAGLKQLMGRYYGAWGQALEAEFKLENLYDPTLLKYAATDPCATFKLYEIEMNYLNKDM